jgi:hypothetical protein
MIDSNPKAAKSYFEENRSEIDSANHARMTKLIDRSVADGMNPTMDAVSSLIGDAGAVNKAWYRWKKEGGAGEKPWWVGGGN